MSVVPGKRYTIAEVNRLRVAYPDLKLPGMVTRTNGDGTVSFIPWQAATGGGMLNRNGELDAPNRMFGSQLAQPFGDLPVRKRREALEKLNSLKNKTRADFMRGAVMPREEIATYTDAARAKQLRAGAALTESDLTDVMAAFIMRAAKIDEAAESKKVVRTAPSD